MNDDISQSIRTVLHFPQNDNPQTKIDIIVFDKKIKFVENETFDHENLT